MTSIPYEKIHIVINPAAGKDEPILNVLNDVFGQYGVDWSVSVTKKYGDAATFARQAAQEGADLFAYAVSIKQRGKPKRVDYRVTIDGKVEEFKAVKIYVVNSGMTGSGFAVTHDYAVDDGLLDAFVLDSEDLATISGAVDRFLHLNTKNASTYSTQCREIVIETEPDQPVWTDGEYLGRTPVTVKVLPGVLPIAVPTE